MHDLRRAFISFETLSLIHKLLKENEKHTWEVYKTLSKEYAAFERSNAFLKDTDFEKYHELQEAKENYEAAKTAYRQFANVLWHGVDAR